MIIQVIPIITCALIIVWHTNKNIYIGTILNQKAHNINIAFGDRNVNGTLTRGRYRVRIAFFLEQRFHQRVIALKAGVMQQSKVTHQDVLEFTSSTILDQIHGDVRAILIDGGE